jgi:cyclic pyranopterin phosphate synthase
MAMVNISQKPKIYREAIAKGEIILMPATVQRIQAGQIEKGDPIQTAKIAGVMGAKQTPSVIPLCHPIPITGVSVQIHVRDSSTLEVETVVKSQAQTGVEMEALVATTLALLTIWDMTKQYEKDSQGQYPNTAIQNIRVIMKQKRSPD